MDNDRPLLFQPPPHDDGIEWQRSTKCWESQCVEVGRMDGIDTVFVRDSKHPEAIIWIKGEHWNHLLNAIKDGTIQ